MMRIKWKKTFALFLAGVLIFGLVPVANALAPDAIDWKDTRLHATAYDPDNEQFFQAFAFPDSSKDMLGGVLLGADGTMIEAWQYDNATDDVINELSIDYDPIEKRYVVVWSAENLASGVFETYVGYIDSSSPGLLQNVQTLCTGCRHASLAVNPADGGVAVSHVANDTELKVAYVDSSGTVEHFLVKNAASPIAQTKLVHVDGNRFYLAWKESGLTTSLYGSFFELVPAAGSYQMLVDGNMLTYTVSPGTDVAIAPDGAGGVTVLAYAGYVNAENKDLLRVTKAVYGQILAGPNDVLLDSVPNTAYPGLGIARDEEGRYAVLLERQYVVAGENYTELIGLYIDGDLGGYTEPAYLASGTDRLYAHLIRNPSDFFIHYAFKFFDSVVLLPFVIGQTPSPPQPPDAQPAVYQYPQLSYEPDTGDYLMLAEGDNNLAFYRVKQRKDADELTFVGSFKLDPGEYDMAYDGNGQHLAVMSGWYNGSPFKSLHGLYVKSGTFSPFELAGLALDDVFDLHVFHVDGKFMLMYTTYQGDTKKLIARTVDGTALGAGQQEFNLGDGFFPGTGIVELTDDRFAAVWIHQSGDLFVQMFRFLEDGSVQLIGEKAMLPSFATGEIEEMRVSAGSDGSKLIIGGYLFTEFEAPGTIVWTTAEFNGGNQTWQFGAVSNIQVPAFAFFFDFDVYTGQYYDDLPVVAWLWKNGMNELMWSILYPDGQEPEINKMVTNRPAGYGTIKFAHGRNRLNLLVQAHSEGIMRENVAFDFLPLSLDFEQELKDMGAGDKITILDLVKYVRQLNFDRFGYAVQHRADKLFELIRPIQPQP